MNFESFVSADFASMYDLVLKSISSREIARKLQTIHRWESSRIRIVERTRKVVALKKFARKLQNTHRWKSLHESFRLSSLEYWAEDTSDCCEKVLKVQFSQMLQSEFSCMYRSIETSVLTFAHFLCFHLHVFYLYNEISEQWMIITHKSFNTIDLRHDVFVLIANWRNFAYWLSSYWNRKRESQSFLYQIDVEISKNSSKWK